MNFFSCMAGRKVYYRLPSSVDTITILCILASVEVIREKNALCTPVYQVRLVTALMVSPYCCKSGCGSCSSWRGCRSTTSSRCLAVSCSHEEASGDSTWVQWSKSGESAGDLCAVSLELLGNDDGENKKGNVSTY